MGGMAEDKLWQWYYLYTVCSLAEQGKANEVFSCPWDPNKCLFSWPWSTSSPSHWHVCGPASPASVLLCSWINTRLCLEVIVPSHFKEWVLGLKNKCFCGLAAHGPFHTGVMLVVSVGSWGGGAGSVSSCPSLCAPFNKFRGLFFPPVISSNPQTSLGKKYFCSAVVLDSFLFVHMVACTLYSARPLCCWVKLPILEWFVFWDHPPSPYSCKNKSVISITLQIWEKFSIGSCYAIGVICVLFQFFCF